jgi:hypothetical protein
LTYYRHIQNERRPSGRRYEACIPSSQTFDASSIEFLPVPLGTAEVQEYGEKHFDSAHFTLTRCVYVTWVTDGTYGGRAGGGFCGCGSDC